MQPSGFTEPADIRILRKAYPDIQFDSSFDFKLNDWKIDVYRADDSTAKAATFYWAGGKMLPADKLDNAESYWPLMYKYNKDIADPADFTEAAINTSEMLLQRKPAVSRRERRLIFSTQYTTAKQDSPLSSI